MDPARGVRCISIVRGIAPRRSCAGSLSRRSAVLCAAVLTFGRCTSEVFLSVSIYNSDSCLRVVLSGIAVRCGVYCAVCAAYADYP